MIPIKKVIHQDTVRRFSFDLKYFDDEGNEITEPCRVGYFSPTYKGFLEAKQFHAGQMPAFPDPNSTGYEYVAGYLKFYVVELPDFVDEEKKPIKLDADFFDNLDYKIAEQIFNALLENISPKSQAVKSKNTLEQQDGTADSTVKSKSIKS